MLTAAPLPEWSDFLSLVFTSTGDDQTLSSPWRKKGDYPYWFSRSAWALHAIILWWEEYNKKKEPIVWFPDYFCVEPLWAVFQKTQQVFFYPINERLHPDWDACKKITAKPDIFILVHYFGHPSESKEARAFCDLSGALLVEDCAHVMLPTQGIGMTGDFVFYSLYKNLALPDGSLLLLCSKSQYFVNQDITMALEIMKRTINMLSISSPSPLKWLIKRGIQKMLPAALAGALRKAQTFDDDAQIEAFPITPAISIISKKLLKRYAGRLSEMAEKRRLNKRVIDAILNIEDNVKPLFVMNPSSELIPYISPFVCPDKKAAKIKFEAINRSGGIVQFWPYLPCQVKSEPDFHRVALMLRNTVVTFPVHQTVSMQDYLNSYGRIVKHKIGSFHNEYSIDNYEVSQEEWNSFLEGMEHTSLTQSWAYGEAKAECEKWKVLRGIIKRGKQSIAIFQALQKKIPLIGTLIRINRGPLMIDANITHFDLYGVFMVLKKWPVFKGAFLLIVPELYDEPESGVMLTLLNYIRLRENVWHSSLLDLSREEKELRSSLKGKWRNQLAASERSGIVLKISYSSEDFEWLLTNHNILMKEKRYQGPSDELLRSLREKMVQKDDFVMLIALNNNLPAAGIVMIKHGLTCTYLLGWNGPEGRAIHANNYLLWNAIVEMKRRGCKWLDLGGLDEKSTPHITRFKRGVGGMEYKLAGEYIGF
ncbi:MAG: peptidoglycan bridge formation glycyltransferase FemA/FemB family protein [Candidatus Eremiobacteraeota bacterium]|nr:peptidoglycan bridge formation glycyltransferase FemA/FemB family protein [Candidatus Eremiobacteraeota bacterium]